MYVHLVEKRPTIRNRSRLKRILDVVFEKVVWKNQYVKKICISQEIFRECNEPKIIVPPVSSISNKQLKTALNFDLLYVGSFAYYNDFVFISDIVKLLPSYSINIIVSGDFLEVREVEKLFTKLNNVKVHSNVPDTQYNSLLSCTKIGLVPLENSSQNRYRFPNKFAQYVSHGMKVVTCGVGDLNMFKNHDGLFFANYTVESFVREIEKAKKYDYVSTKLQEHFSLDTYRKIIFNF
jgi:hypothetical protein